MNRKNVTFGDIAKYTGFSKTTVSRYFNRPDSLTPENREKIRHALDKLGYQENKVARFLASGRTEFIGVIIPNIYLRYYGEVLTRILDTYRICGYKFLVYIGSDEAEVERRYIQELLSYQVEGLIVLSYTIPSEELARLPIPVVSIEREDRCLDSVNTDNYMGAIQATSLLAKHNCDIFIHINSPVSEEIPAHDRIRGFQDFCTEHSLVHRICLREMGATHASVSAVMKELFEEIEAAYPGQRKGVFLSSDTHANEFLNLVIRKYKKFPDTYRIVGFDDSPSAQEAIYSISTVGQQIDRVAREAVRMLIDKIERQKKGEETSGAPVHKVITPVLLRRETTELYN